MNKFYASRQPTSNPFLPCLGPAVNKIYDINIDTGRKDAIFIYLYNFQFKNVLIKSAQVVNNKFPIISGECSGF